METNLFRYIWSHTRREQIWIIVVTILAMIPYYMSFDLPKQIINGPITGIGFETPDATLPFMRFEVDLPIVGSVMLSPGVELERIPILFALSFTFLALVIINGLIKIYINIYKGRLGERLLRRIRFDLVDRILRFPPKRFKSVKAGEVASMVKDEVEPFGGFSGEAFASPVMLAGQALTAMMFIFVQHIGLGLVALVMASIQVLIIPKLRARLIVLGRERQLNARRLSGRVAEIVDGIDTIHGMDATNYVRADIVDRLGRIFKIRYDIYQWKFFVKFLNNFIAQLTPFIFYSFGGYLAIAGKLDVGQLVAVINAYKELPGPLKGLIDWDMARQDIQVKYEGITSQFDVEKMIDPDKQLVDPSPRDLHGHPLQIRSVSLEDDSGTSTLERANAKFESGEVVAFVGSGGSGAEELAEAIGRIVWPSEGAVQIGETDLLQLPESVSGRRVSYASPREYFFSGSLGENLLFGLKNAPRTPARYEGKEAEYRRWWWQEAELTGNPALDLNDGWVDETDIFDHAGTASVPEAIDKALSIVEMREDISQLALRCPLDPETDADLAKAILGIRREFADELARRGWQDLVLPFDQSAYNDEATIGENLYYGNFIEEGAVMRVGTSPFMREIALETGLARTLFQSGKKIAETAVGLFRDLPAEHPFFERMKLFKPEELPEFRQILDRVEGREIDQIADEDRARIMWLNAHYSEPWYRFGIVTEEFKSLIVDVRNRIRKGLPEEFAAEIEFYDPDRYMFHADIRENIIFGKANSLVMGVGERLAQVGMALRERNPEVLGRVLRLGMTFDVGPGGRRLSGVQKTKLNLARALLRRSDIYVFNRPLLGVEPEQQRRIIDASLSFLKDRQAPPLVIWVLADPAHAPAFDRVLRFDGGSVVSDQPIAEFVGDGTAQAPAAT